MLVIIRRQACKEKEQTGQKRQSLWRKRTPGKVELELIAQRDKELGEKFDAKWNEGSGDLETRSHPATLVHLQLHERELYYVRHY